MENLGMARAECSKACRDTRCSQAWIHQNPLVKNPQVTPSGGGFLGKTLLNIAAHENALIPCFSSSSGKHQQCQKKHNCDCARAETADEESGCR